MNKDMIEGFMKRAMEAGLTKEQAEQFLLSQVSTKSASAPLSLETYVDSIINAAQVQKTAHAVGYVEGVLKQAVDNGFELDKAAEVAVYALSNNNAFQKVAAAQPKVDTEHQQKLAAYSEEFIKAATEYGFTVGQSIDMLNHVVKQAEAAQTEKRANPEIEALLAQLGGGQGGPAGMPGAEAMGGMGGMGGQGGGMGGLDLQSLLGMLGGGGQGGAAGAGAGGAGLPGMDMFKNLAQ